MTNNKKRILFVVPSYEIGGITSSLYSLIRNLDSNRVGISLLCRHHVGPMKQAFEQCCFVLPENVWLSLFLVESHSIKRFVGKAIGAVRRFMRMIGVNMTPIYNKIGGKQLGLEKYDAIISFHEGLNPIVSTYPAKKRIAWIHCDYSRQRQMTGKDEQKEYERFDKIVCVSGYARSVFCQIYPALNNKTTAIHNLLDVKGIKEKSLQVDDLDPRYNYSNYTILSMGRLDPVKQFAMIPSIAAQVKCLTNKPFKWYILGGSRGFNSEENNICNAIQQNGVEEDVILLGEKTNVYPYLAKANLYVCTSESESYPLAVNEAEVLGLPVISNDFPSASESIVDGRDGYISSIENMPKLIAEMLDHPMQIREYESKNSEILDSFYQLIEE